MPRTTHKVWCLFNCGLRSVHFTHILQGKFTGTDITMEFTHQDKLYLDTSNLRLIEWNLKPYLIWTLHNIQIKTSTNSYKNYNAWMKLLSHLFITKIQNCPCASWSEINARYVAPFIHSIYFCLFSAWLRWLSPKYYLYGGNQMESIACGWGIAANLGIHARQGGP